MGFKKFQVKLLFCREAFEKVFSKFVIHTRYFLLFDRLKADLYYYSVYNNVSFNTSL